VVVFKLRPSQRALILVENATPFSTLPSAIREQICTHVIVPLPSSFKPYRFTVSAADAIHGSDLWYPYFLAALCRVSEATRIDVGLWFIRNTEFGLLYPPVRLYEHNFALRHERVYRSCPTCWQRVCSALT
jgi:hypothetical protein